MGERKMDLNKEIEQMLWETGKHSTIMGLYGKLHMIKDLQIWLAEAETKVRAELLKNEGLE